MVLKAAVNNHAALAVHSLVKRYGERVALDKLSFDIAPGQFVALLGRNGAGKSTLFQVLTGLFAADAGEAEVAGHSLRHAPTQALAEIGVVFQQMSLDLDLSVERNLRFHVALHGLPRKVADERLGQDALCVQRRRCGVERHRPRQRQAHGFDQGRR